MDPETALPLCSGDLCPALLKLPKAPLTSDLANRAKQQAKMAEYCRSIFGDALLIDPLDKYPVWRLELRRGAGWGGCLSRP